MKVRGIKMTCLYSLIVAIVLAFPVYAQQEPPKPEAKAEETKTEVKSEKKEMSKEEAYELSPRDAYTEAERPEENYLARFDAIKVSERLIKENLENIYMLKVIVSNYKDQGWEKDYDKIYQDYKKAVSFFYRRIVIYSRVELEKNRKDIQDLCKKMVVFYRVETQKMLKECADKILDFSLDERNRFDPNRTKVLNQNMMRLWIAYGQTDDAERSFVDKIYKSSIFHYRIAKSYAITILEELDPEKSKGRFDVQKADNRNRVLSPDKGDRKDKPIEEKTEQPKV